MRAALLAVMVVAAPVGADEFTWRPNWLPGQEWVLRAPYERVAWDGIGDMRFVEDGCVYARFRVRESDRMLSATDHVLEVIVRVGEEPPFEEVEDRYELAIDSETGRLIRLELWTADGPDEEVRVFADRYDRRGPRCAMPWDLLGPGHPPPDRLWIVFLAMSASPGGGWRIADSPLAGDSSRCPQQCVEVQGDVAVVSFPRAFPLLGHYRLVLRSDSPWPEVEDPAGTVVNRLVTATRRDCGQARGP